MLKSCLWQGLDTFLKRGLVDNAYSGLAQQRPHTVAGKQDK